MRGVAQQLSMLMLQPMDQEPVQRKRRFAMGRQPWHTTVLLLARNLRVSLPEGMGMPSVLPQVSLLLQGPKSACSGWRPASTACFVSHSRSM